ncbi:MAG: tyrosine-type recombinase/integrase [Pseudomonadota bacterium]
MELIAATKDLVIGAHPYPGFPIVLWANMESCAPVNSFLRYYLLRGSIGSKRSWGSTGRALYDFFSFLQANDLQWQDVDRGEDKSLLSAYRDYCFDVAKLARNTVRQRLLYICEFYKFAHRNDWIEKLPFTYEQRASFHRNEGFLAHIHGGENTVSVPDVMPRRQKDLPKFLSKDGCKALLKATTNPHHLMLIRMALLTGLRREELASFPLQYVVNPALYSGNNIQVRLDPKDGHNMMTKGTKARDLWISRRLMAALHHYVIHRRNERGSMAAQVHNNLFLNQNGEPYSGDGKSICRLISGIGQRAGVKVHTHMLRHTYATHTLVALQRDRGDTKIEPLVFLQRQLGHASINTTMIYSHLVNELADEAVLKYDDELNDWIDPTNDQT